jgi:hypothetical protein
VSRTAPRRRARRGERSRLPRGARRPVAERADTDDSRDSQTGSRAILTERAPGTEGRSARDPSPGPEPDDREPVREEVVPAPTAAAVGEIRVLVRPSQDEPHNRLAVALWTLAVLAGLACLVAALVPAGPSYLDRVGAVVVVSAYTWALAARTGGRPLVFGGLALLLGAGVLLADLDYLRTGAAVITCVIAAVLAVMLTVPAAGFLQVARECLVAWLVAAVGALATVGFDPVISLVRFEYSTLVLALVAAFGVVYRLGAGLHGLGRRGVLAVLLGGVLLVVTMLYAEMLRRYGPEGLVPQLLDGVRWSRDHLGAFPRPIETAFGVPALAWGCYMRARRRQGWWLCAFGVAATVPVANSLVNPAISLLECALSVVYGLVLGLALAYVVIRVDLALTGSRGAGGRRLERAGAVRPEPPRTSALL